MAHYTKQKKNKKKKTNERKFTKENKSRVYNVCLSVRHGAVDFCVTLKMCLVGVCCA